MKYKYHHNEAQYIYQDAIAMIEYMTQLITLPIQAHKVLEEVVAFRQSDAILQEKNLPKNLPNVGAICGTIRMESIVNEGTTFYLEL